MRLIAALLVVVSHTFPLSGQPAFRIMGVEDLGALGVSIFFVISGFLVAASYQRDPRTYLVKRVLRIEPGLIASLAATVLALGFVTTAPAAEYWPKAGLYVLRNALLYPATYELLACLDRADGGRGHVLDPAVRVHLLPVLWLIRARLSCWRSPCSAPPSGSP